MIDIGITDIDGSSSDSQSTGNTSRWVHQRVPSPGSFGKLRPDSLQNGGSRVGSRSEYVRFGEPSLCEIKSTLMADGKWEAQA